MNRLKNIVAMKRGQNKVTRLSGHRRDGGGLFIPNLTNQYDIGILPEKVSESRGKGNTSLGVYLNLCDIV